MKTAKSKSNGFFPKYPIRQSQLVSPWGVGAMIDYPNNESLMICGLDAWVYPEEEAKLHEFVIEETRLQRRLQTTHFRLPPDYRKYSRGIINPNITIPAVRFPKWHFCDWCGGLEELSAFGTQQQCTGREFLKGRSCHTTHERRRRNLVPLRFIAACENGHIRDFPWMEWVHREKPETMNCALRLQTGSSASLAGLYVNCECGQWKSLSGAYSDDALKDIAKCNGERPWLGDTEGKGGCSAPLKVLQKGGSNVFFPLTISSIHIPPLSEDEEKEHILSVLDIPDNWDIITSGTVDGELDEAKCKMFAAIKKLDADKLYELAKYKFAGVTDTAGDVKEMSEEEFRQDEYTVLTEGKSDIDSDLSCRSVNPEDYYSPVKEYLSGLTLVDQLRETKAFVGFSRVIPAGDFRPVEKIRELKLNSSIDWLPAVIVRGEGLFFKLNEELVKTWSDKPDVTYRAQKLSENYYSSFLAQGKMVNGNITPKFILLHTLAHLLINQLSFDCGYGSSSLRERIYCDIENSTFPMTGLLIYTASGDSEGTMGGLVRQGKKDNLEKIFTRALKNALWCSSDPVCIESKGQGPGSCNFAACHGCALLPETSCEKSNKLIDRALVIGTPENPAVGFFSKFIESI